MTDVMPANADKAQSVANCKKCFTCLNELRCRKYPAPPFHQKKYLKRTRAPNGHHYRRRVSYRRRYPEWSKRAEVNIKVLHIHHISELIRP